MAPVTPQPESTVPAPPKSGAPRLLDPRDRTASNLIRPAVYVRPASWPELNAPTTSIAAEASELRPLALRVLPPAHPRAPVSVPVDAGVGAGEVERVLTRRHRRHAHLVQATVGEDRLEFRTVSGGKTLLELPFSGLEPVVPSSQIREIDLLSHFSIDPQRP